MIDEERTGLGAYLKSLRDSKGLTLREVEEKSGVSNAFVSQVESGKVKQPAPIILFKLAELYGIPYETLMERAGYPVSKKNTPTIGASAAIFHKLGKITEKEEQELLDYLTFLRSRAKREGRKK
jgi:transcriptional regulator with XRE-family HTH domain